MTLQRRKTLVAGVVVGILALTHLNTLVHWLHRAGIIELANWVGERYLTGTAVAIMVTLIFLTTDASRIDPMDHSRRCRTCDRALARDGRYCPHCGGLR
ncbi:MAG: hypothetical protein ABSH20_22885 [Tepidisphaeraceae bacterium]